MLNNPEDWHLSYKDGYIRCAKDILKSMEEKHLTDITFLKTLLEILIITNTKENNNDL